MRLFGWVSSGDVGAPQQIICTGVIKVGQLAQNRNGDLPGAALIVGVADLRAFQMLGKILLSQVTILAQSANPFA